eukprot:TRINITY_DN62522_c0_g1_i1.p1 TRINITY_DN62522_c0_g1~~TRINITY_DN62522_c0_g1_i1.p1  ORF type:complete len:444 (-),score=99.00 TRINITY_DN62522_c0_g1_i1:192-1523(-)
MCNAPKATESVVQGAATEEVNKNVRAPSAEDVGPGGVSEGDAAQRDEDCDNSPIERAKRRLKERREQLDAEIQQEREELESYCRERDAAHRERLQRVEDERLRRLAEAKKRQRELEEIRRKEEEEQQERDSCIRQQRELKAHELRRRIKRQMQEQKAQEQHAAKGIAGLRQSFSQVGQRDPCGADSRETRHCRIKENDHMPLRPASEHRKDSVEEVAAPRCANQRNDSSSLRNRQGKAVVAPKQSASVALPPISVPRRGGDADARTDVKPTASRAQLQAQERLRKKVEEEKREQDARDERLAEVRRRRLEKRTLLAEKAVSGRKESAIRAAEWFCRENEKEQQFRAEQEDSRHILSQQRAKYKTPQARAEVKACSRSMPLTEDSRRKAREKRKARDREIRRWVAEQETTATVSEASRPSSSMHSGAVGELQGTLKLSDPPSLL